MHIIWHCAQLYAAVRTLRRAETLYALYTELILFKQLYAELIFIMQLYAELIFTMQLNAAERALRICTRFTKMHSLYAAEHNCARFTQLHALYIAVLVLRTL